MVKFRETEWWLHGAEVRGNGKLFIGYKVSSQWINKF